MHSSESLLFLEGGTVIVPTCRLWPENLRKLLWVHKRQNRASDPSSLTPDLVPVNAKLKKLDPVPNQCEVFLKTLSSEIKPTPAVLTLPKA
ncbi:hypothetical protein CapIbe_013340 [Capra ibex]